MADRPKVQVVDYGDPDHVSIFVNGKEVGEAYNDRNADSRTAVQQVTNAVRDVAKALGADVEAVDEPERQPYRYFITFTATERVTWRQPWRALLHGGTITAGAWFGLDGEITGPDDTKRIADHLAGQYPTPTIVMITGITLIDAPC